MIETRYYGSGRTEHVTPEDGAHWREATPAELHRLLREDPWHRVIVGVRGQAVPACHFSGMVLAGGYPFLPGIAALIPVYAEIECLDEVP